MIIGGAGLDSLQRSLRTLRFYDSVIFGLATCKYIGISKICTYAYVAVYRKCIAELKTAKKILFIKLEVTKCVQHF